MLDHVLQKLVLVDVLASVELYDAIDEERKVVVVELMISPVHKACLLTLELLQHQLIDSQIDVAILRSLRAVALLSALVLIFLPREPTSHVAIKIRTLFKIVVYVQLGHMDALAEVRQHVLNAIMIGQNIHEADNFAILGLVAIAEHKHIKQRLIAPVRFDGLRDGFHENVFLHGTRLLFMLKVDEQLGGHSFITVSKLSLNLCCSVQVSPNDIPHIQHLISDEQLDS